MIELSYASCCPSVTYQPAGWVQEDTGDTSTAWDTGEVRLWEEEKDMQVNKKRRGG